MKKITQVLELSHDDLVNLFSTALYGSPYLSANYDKDFYNSLEYKQKNESCFEDKLAECVLNGGCINFCDEYADGEVYSVLGNVMDDGTVIYRINLDNIIDGLIACDNMQRGVSGKRCFDEFELGDDGNMDFSIADELLQNIIFGEAVYG